MDTARADFVRNPTVMPTLAALREQGCSFTRCFANAPWTLPSHSSIFSGQRPAHHGVAGKGDMFNVEADVVSILGRNGYQTAAFSNNPWISPDFGFDAFDEFLPGWKRFRRGADLAGISQLESRTAQVRSLGGKLFERNAPFTLANAIYMRYFQDRTDSGARLTTRRLIDWIDGTSEEQPFFAFVNFMEPHLEYDPPDSVAREFLPDDVSPAAAAEINQDPWAYLVGEESMSDSDFKLLKDLYRAELAYLDNEIGSVVTFLRESDRLSETAIFVLGDHGENIGHHGLMDHQYSLRDSLLHVPLVVRYPNAFDSETTCDDIVELRDLFPTVLELAAVQVPDIAGDQPQSLQSAVAQSGREYAIAEYPTPQPAIETLRDRYSEISVDLTQFDCPLRSVRTAEWRFVERPDGRNELYEVHDDGATEHHSSGSRASVESQLNGVLDRELGPLSEWISRSDQQSGTISDANQEHLEDLGYL